MYNSWIRVNAKAKGNEATRHKAKYKGPEPKLGKLKLQPVNREPRV